MDHAVSTEGVTSAGTTDSSTSQFPYKVFTAIVGAVGITGNLFALVVLLCYKEMRERISSILLINQCLIDVSASFFFAAYYIQHSFDSQTLTVPYLGLAGDLYCRLWESELWHWGLICASTYNLLAITVERYFMVIQPLYHKIHITRKKLYLVAASVWLFGILFQSLGVVPTTALEGGACLIQVVWPSDHWYFIWGVISVLVPYLIPAILMTAMYGHMLVKICAKAKASFGSNTAYNLNRAQRSLIKTLVVVLVAFFCCWTPNEVYWLLYCVGVELQLSQVFHSLFIMLIYINCSVNPFIYIFSYKKFQDGIKHLFGCLHMQAAADTESGSGTVAMTIK